MAKKGVVKLFFSQSNLKYLLESISNPEILEDGITDKNKEYQWVKILVIYFARGDWLIVNLLSKRGLQICWVCNRKPKVLALSKTCIRLTYLKLPSAL